MLAELLKKWGWFIKNSLLIVAYAVVALPLYHLVAEIHIREPTTLFTPIDYMIPFVSFFAIFYVFIYYPFFLFSIGLFSYIRKEKADKFFTALFSIYIVSYITYIIFPVMMIRPAPEELPKDFLSQVMAKYYEQDPPLNCFPSLHAATSTLSAYFYYQENKKIGIVAWVITFLIILSTLFVRQHVIADEIAGFLVAFIFGHLSNKFIREGEREEKIPLWRITFTIVLWLIITMYLISQYIP